jgi:hypothetical protein
MKDKNKGNNPIRGTWGGPEMLRTYPACTTNKKPELLNDILQETEIVNK